MEGGEAPPIPEMNPSKDGAHLFTLAARRHPGSVVKQAAFIALDCQEKKVDPDMLGKALFYDRRAMSDILKTTHAVHEMVNAKRRAAAQENGTPIEEIKQVPFHTIEDLDKIVTTDFDKAAALVRYPKELLEKVLAHDPGKTEGYDDDMEDYLQELKDELPID